MYVSLLTLPAQDMQNGWRGSLEIDLFIIHTYVCGCAKVLPIRDLINYLCTPPVLVGYSALESLPAPSADRSWVEE